MTMTVDERVEIGARFLDDTLPNWRACVSTEWLRMSSCTSCVLGQLFGWQKGVEALYEWWGRQSLLGLDDAALTALENEPLAESAAGFEKTDDDTYPELQRAWERVIEPQCDGCDQDPWRAPVHYGTCPLNTRTTV